MRIERSALVTHSAQSMYRLVADVPAYPQFLSWCDAAVVYEHSEFSQKAELAVTIAGISQKFSTLNTLLTGERVEMKLLQGPFRELQGRWCFTPLGEQGSSVSLKLEFQIAGGLLTSVFGTGFGHIANRLVADFCQRADQVYG